MNSPTADGGIVTVTLSNCSADDARRVLSHLTARFPDRSGTGNAPAVDTHATVWTAQLDASADPTDSAPPSEGVDGQVSVTVQGAPHDVSAVRATLAQDFSLQDSGSASGDQERESQFELLPK
ncbi:hypothetical protein G3I40_04270 [Streptomyces sp. SID14478]|uniref:hypothetical protein n=1 Tax=Streptomyces sp. SID14478 TaxID=2706073 RepID=UPI0013DAFC16|nr:hypothetical protein [Streptomyces sp. SID14478]NEB74449.1 hypothetical protein [Streptomyces sp. SID14478]